MIKNYIKDIEWKKILSGEQNKKLKISINDVMAKIVELNETIQQITLERPTKQQAKVVAEKICTNRWTSLYPTQIYSTTLINLEPLKPRSIPHLRSGPNKSRPRSVSFLRQSPVLYTLFRILITKEMVAKNDNFLNILENYQLNPSFPTLPAISPGEPLNRYIEDNYKTLTDTINKLKLMIFTIPIQWIKIYI